MDVYHASTLEDRYIEATYRLLRGIADYSYTHHALEQKNLKRVAHWNYILDNGKLIELKIDKEFGMHRALLRTADGHCAVFCWRNKKVITTWYNSPTDNHYTIRPEQYILGVNHLV